MNECAHLIAMPNCECCRQRGTKNLMNAIDLQETLSKKTSKELVDLALHHIPTAIPKTYEAVILELCSRVQPGWEHEKDDDPNASHRWICVWCNTVNGNDIKTCVGCNKLIVNQSYTYKSFQEGRSEKK